MPGISIVLPIYNAALRLERALSSVSAQSHSDFECILVDNQSTDESAQIASEWVKKDPRFQLVSEPRQGVVYASNRGTDLAVGKYLTRMDADDWMPVDRLDKQFAFLEAHADYDVVSGMVSYLPHKAETEGFARYVRWVNSVKSMEQISLSRFIESPIVNPTAMWRKTVSDQLGMYRDGDFPEDYELWLRWISRGVRIHKLNNIVLHWQDSDKRLTRTHPNYSEEAFYRIKTQYLAMWLAVHNPHHPEVAIWGASRLSRKRAQILHDHGITVRFLIDIHTRRQLEKNLIHYSELPDPGEVFVLVYLGNEDARRETNHYLTSKGYLEGLHFLNI